MTSLSDQRRHRRINRRYAHNRLLWGTTTDHLTASGGDQE